MTNDTRRSAKEATPGVMRNIFGIIMIIIYVGMGILCFCGAFPWFTGDWAWLRWVGGAIFVVYGIWRATDSLPVLTDRLQPQSY